MILPVATARIFCLNPIGTDVGKEIKTLTGKQGADEIIETSGYADALQSAFRGLAYGGTISYVAFAKPFAEGFNLGREAHFNNAKIVFSRACSEPNPDYPRWSRKRIEETCWELLMNGYLNCEDLIDPVVVAFANSPESYMQYVDQHPEQSIKMGVTFSNSKDGKNENRHTESGILSGKHSGEISLYQRDGLRWF